MKTMKYVVSLGIQDTTQGAVDAMAPAAMRADSIANLT